MGKTAFCKSANEPAATAKTQIIDSISAESAWVRRAPATILAQTADILV